MTLTEQSAPASSSPGLAALGAGLSDEDDPLVGRPTDDSVCQLQAILGHQRIETTMTYVKRAIPCIRQPW